MFDGRTMFANHSSGESSPTRRLLCRHRRLLPLNTSLHPERSPPDGAAAAAQRGGRRRTIVSAMSAQVATARSKQRRPRALTAIAANCRRCPGLRASLTRALQSRAAPTGPAPHAVAARRARKKRASPPVMARRPARVALSGGAPRG